MSQTVLAQSVLEHWQSGYNVSSVPLHPVPSAVMRKHSSGVRIKVHHKGLCKLIVAF